MKFRVEISEGGSIEVHPTGPPIVTLESLRAKGVPTYGGCSRVYGPQGGISDHFEKWRANGMLKTWKTRPTEFRLPLKYGLRGYGELTHRNATAFHHADECPCSKLPNDREGLLALLVDAFGYDDATKPGVGVLDLDEDKATGTALRRSHMHECEGCGGEWGCAGKTCALPQRAKCGNAYGNPPGDFCTLEAKEGHNGRQQPLGAS